MEKKIHFARLNVRKIIIAHEIVTEKKILVNYVSKGHKYFRSRRHSYFYVNYL